MDITYTLSLTVTRSLRDCDPSFTMAEHCEAMESQKAKTELEREVLQALRKLDGDCDCEVMETARETTAHEDDAMFTCACGAEMLDWQKDDHICQRPTRTERLQAMADRGIYTWEDYRGER